MLVDAEQEKTTGYPGLCGIVKGSIYGYYGLRQDNLRLVIFFLVRKLSTRWTDTLVPFSIKTDGAKLSRRIWD
jgi:hypothetical protein